MKSQLFNIAIAGLLGLLVFDISCSKSNIYCPSCGTPGASNGPVTRTISLTLENWIDKGNRTFESDFSNQIHQIDSSFTNILGVKVRTITGQYEKVIDGQVFPLWNGNLVWVGEILTFYSGTSQLPFTSVSVAVTVD